MKKSVSVFIISIFVLAVLIPTLIYTGLHFYIDSLFPPKFKQKIDFVNPKHAIEQLVQEINIEKVQIEKNNKKLSGIDWCHHDFKKFKVSNVFAEMNDQIIRDANESIIKLMEPNYLVRAGIQKKKFNNIKAAKTTIDEFEKIVDDNKYIKSYSETKEFIKSFRARNGL